MLTRDPHWATRSFYEFLVSNAHRPFAWGTWDCALFAAAGILAMTGVDLAAPFRGQYSDEGGAWAAVKSICGGASIADAAAWCAQQHQMPERLHPLTAQRGDLAVVRNGGGLIAGLVDLSGSRVATVNDAGIVHLPITATVRSWRV